MLGVGGGPFRQAPSLHTRTVAGLYASSLCARLSVHPILSNMIQLQHASAASAATKPSNLIVVHLAARLCTMSVFSEKVPGGKLGLSWDSPEGLLDYLPGATYALPYFSTISFIASAYSPRRPRGP